ncbi:MAG: hypothetical protein KAV87_02285 [Desulfobacteraceae bacterium]|nr:hypothetical protein [Desulfobacteraceae bacterium]
MSKKTRKQKKREKLRKQGMKRRRRVYAVNPSVALSNLKQVLSKYEQKELIANLGGLQLAPENHTHTLRLEIASRIARSIETAEHAGVDLDKLRNKLNEHLPSQGIIGLQEDPVESLFTENIIFHGGNYIVYSGIVDSGSFILNNFLKAIFHLGDGLNDDFKEIIKSHTMALLCISNEVAKHVGHIRNIVSPNTWRKDIYVPSKGKTGQFRDAVSFSKNRIDSLLVSRGLSAELLSPFVISPSDPSLIVEDPDKNPLCGKPLVKSDGMIILAQPGSITSALRHFIFTTAKRMNLIDKLASNYRETLSANVDKSLDRMFFKSVDINLPNWEGHAPVEESVYRIDNNKLVYVQTIVDDANKYEEREVFGHWDNKHIAKKSQDRRESIVKWLLQQKDLNCSEVLLVVVLGGMGRFIVFGLPKQPSRTRTEIMHAEELEIISNLRECDRLTLWKHAGAKEKMLNKFPKCFGISSFLDVYALYLDYHHSFNLSDEGPVIPVMAPGYGHKLRVKSVETSDIHAVLMKPKGLPSRYVTVTRRYEGDPIPIYVLYESLSPFTRLVEGYEQPIWVMRDYLPEYNSRDLDDIYFKVTDLVAYWLWQATDSLRPHLRSLGKTPINIRLRLDRPKNWANILSEKRASSVEDFNYAVEQFDIVLCVPDGIQEYLSKVDNEADRLILDALLRAFDMMLLEHGKPQSLTEEVRQSILDAHAPCGPKKMLNLFNQDRAALNPEHLPSLRKLQEHDLEEQLDDLVKELNDKTLVVGEIKDRNKRLALVGKIVDLYLNRLKSVLSRFSWHPLLEQLIVNSEAAHHRRVIRSFTMSTDIACFSDILSIVEREKDEKIKITTTSISTRTLIEFIAAEPPKGKQCVSVDEFDRLLAIAHHIFNWGSFFDQIKLGVFDHRLSILGSGRIGRDTEPIEKFRNTFFTEKVREDVEHSVSSPGAFVNPEKNKEAKSNFQDMNDAFVGEFGLTMTQIKEFHTCLSYIGFDQKKACASLPISKLRESIKERVGHIPDWTDDKIELAIGLYSLKPRKKWNNVPKGFLKSDIYPWRYNRRLSYMYRPLIIGPAPKDDPLFFWGPRHVEESCIQLFSNVSSGRYKIHRNSSTEMKELLGNIRRHIGEAFTQEVKEWFEANTDWAVKSKVPINPSTLLRADSDLGDIDVLCVDCLNKIVYSIECKHINYGRNPREMASELERFIEEKGDADSWLKRHVKRDTWLKKNVKQLSGLIKLDVKDFKVRSFFLTSEEIPTPYLRDMWLPFVSFSRLKREGIELLRTL